MTKSEDEKVSLGFLLPLLFFEVLIAMCLSEDISPPGGSVNQLQHDEIGASRTSGGGDLMIQ
jgi:hypothetical protein